jgi:hypothetical protein
MLLSYIIKQPCGVIPTHPGIRCRKAESICDRFQSFLTAACPQRLEYSSKQMSFLLLPRLSQRIASGVVETFIG